MAEGGEQSKHKIDSVRKIIIEEAVGGAKPVLTEEGLKKRALADKRAFKDFRNAEKELEHRIKQGRQGVRNDVDDTVDYFLAQKGIKPLKYNK